MIFKLYKFVKILTNCYLKHKKKKKNMGSSACNVRNTVKLYSTQN